MPEVAGIRRFGAAALDLAWVAAGRFDGFWERGLSPWDMAAGHPPDPRGGRLSSPTSTAARRCWKPAISWPATKPSTASFSHIFDG